MSFDEFLPTRKAYYSELKKIGKRISRFMDKVDEELRQMNCYVTIHLSAMAHDFEFDSRDDLCNLAEELFAHQEALGIEVKEMDGFLAELWLKEREEKKPEAKSEEKGL